MARSYNQLTICKDAEEKTLPVTEGPV